MKQSEKRRLRNRVFRGRARSYVRDARQALETDDLAAAREEVRKAISALDKAAEKGVIHRNNASRRKSRLMLKLAALEKEQA
jgi:small subunit ribosomal protein S20